MIFQRRRQTSAVDIAAKPITDVLNKSRPLVLGQRLSVIPAKGGTQVPRAPNPAPSAWVPAFAGMTRKESEREPVGISLSAEEDANPVDKSGMEHLPVESPPYIERNPAARREHP